MTKDRDIKTGRVEGWDHELVHNEKRGYEVLDCDMDGIPEDLNEAATEYLGKPENDEAAIKKFMEWIDAECVKAEKRGYQPKPDWEAQARYDEMHGTINGQDPAVTAWEEAFPYGE